MDGLLQLLTLLAGMVFIVLLFQRWHIPASIAYLLVGVLLGSHTAGPVVDDTVIRHLAEFGIVFLLFTIGLSFSVAQIMALRHTILLLGTAQVVLTTLIVMAILMLFGMDAVIAFVIGAVFAQSSTTIISRQLQDQGEDQTAHGRLATTMSVFQDITAVPFVIVIPVLGVAMVQDIAGSLLLALLKAALAIVLVVVIGRYLLRPFFQLVTSRASGELFTLTVLLLCLSAAWTTQLFGLSMAFGAFLAGMIIGETEFRHQVEAAIRPFRDVLLGLFFVSVGMLFNPMILPDIWPQAALGAALLLCSKLLLVWGVVAWRGVAPADALRTGMILAVGGEFGFALLAIALDAGVIGEQLAQLVLTSVLLSMAAGIFLIRYNQRIAHVLFTHRQSRPALTDIQSQLGSLPATGGHVVVAGFGRTGQIVSRFLDAENIPYIALDMDAGRVANARLAGLPVHFADSTDEAVLQAVGLANARLLLITHTDQPAALRTLPIARQLNPQLPVLVRARDETQSADLLAAGAAEVIPETLEAAMMLVSHALASLKVPLPNIVRMLRGQRSERYRLLNELFRTDSGYLTRPEDTLLEQLRAVLLTSASVATGQTLKSLGLERYQIHVSELIRNGERLRNPPDDTELQSQDVLLLFGTPQELDQAEMLLTGVAKSPSA